MLYLYVNKDYKAIFSFISSGKNSIINNPIACATVIVFIFFILRALLIQSCSFHIDGASDNTVNMNPGGEGNGGTSGNSQPGNFNNGNGPNKPNNPLLPHNTDQDNSDNIETYAPIDRLYSDDFTALVHKACKDTLEERAEKASVSGEIPSKRVELCDIRCWFEKETLRPSVIEGMRKANIDIAN